MKGAGKYSKRNASRAKPSTFGVFPVRGRPEGNYQCTRCGIKNGQISFPECWSKAGEFVSHDMQLVSTV